jgi:hypothetical protein
MKTSCNVAENGGGSYRLLAILCWVMKLPAAVLIAAAMFADPAVVARTSHVTSRHRAKDGRVGMSAPRIGALPPAPANGEDCDVGDNPRIC